METIKTLNLFLLLASLFFITKADDFHKADNTIHELNKTTINKTIREIKHVIDEVVRVNESGETPSLEQQQEACKKIGEILKNKEEGALLSAQDLDSSPRCSPPLHQAVRYGLEHVVAYLIQHKADVNLCEVKSGFAPLHYAVELRRMKIASLLIENGANVNLYRSPVGFGEDFLTPLDIAAKSGDEELFFFLLTNHANPHTKNPYLDEPQAHILHFALYGKNKKIIDYALTQITDINAVKNHRYKPIDIAALNGDSYAFKKIADREHVIFDEATLIAAAQGGKSDIFEYVHKTKKVPIPPNNLPLLRASIESNNQTIIDTILPTITSVTLDEIQKQLGEYTYNPMLPPLVKNNNVLTLEKLSTKGFKIDQEKVLDIATQNDNGPMFAFLQKQGATFNTDGGSYQYLLDAARSSNKHIIDAAIAFAKKNNQSLPADIGIQISHIAIEKANKWNPNNPTLTTLAFMSMCEAGIITPEHLTIVATILQHWKDRPFTHEGIAKRIRETSARGKISSNLAENFIQYVEEQAIRNPALVKRVPVTNETTLTTKIDLPEEGETAQSRWKTGALITTAAVIAGGLAFLMLYKLYKRRYLTKENNEHYETEKHENETDLFTNIT